MRILKKILAVRLTKARRFFERLTNSFWFDYPFGITPKASKANYLELARKTREVIYSEIDDFEKQTEFAISDEWLHDLALHTQIVIKNSPLCYAHGRILYSALSNYLKERSPYESADRITVLETGTARGFSALCMCKALNDQYCSGAILTFDLLPHRTRMYWNCIDDCDGPKSRAELLEPWRMLTTKYIVFHQGDTRLELPKIEVDRIHFAFLDGGHTYDDVIFEFNQIRDHQVTGDMIIYDDYNPKQFPGLVKAVDEICEQFNYRRINLNSHSGRGYVVATKK